MERKYLILNICFFSIAVAISGILLSSCSNLKTINSFSTDGYLVIDKSEFFDAYSKEEYSSIIVTSNSLKSPLILFKTGADSYEATSLECTHNGQRLELVKDKLSCPDDGSIFEKNGKVISGPAKKDLKRYWVDKSLSTIKIQIL